MPQRKRSKGIRPSAGEVKVDFLIPVTQDSPPKRQHPHTAYAEWHKLLFLHGIDNGPTSCGRDKGPEEWGEAEVSDHWWVVTPKRKLQVLLHLLRDEARRIFDQRWIIAWTGEKPYKIGDTIKTKRSK